MKGMVFTEFLEMVSSTFGEDIADDIIDGCDLPSGGVYTSVGTYDHGEIVQLVVELAKIVDKPVEDLIQAFGKYLLSRFAINYPVFFSDKPDVFSLLEGVDQEIHVEVRKLYPDAELPRFSCERQGEGVLVMSYQSTRPFADLAEGLIRGCIAHYEEPIEVAREALSDNATSARFRLTKAA